MDTLTKQIWEEFIIAGDFIDQAGTGEQAVLIGSEVLAEDKDGANVETTLLDQTTKAVDGTQLQIKLRAGTEGASPYKVTWRILTSLGNRWEIDAKIKIKEV